jgi:plastocyanin
MTRKATVLTGAMALVFLSGLAAALPLASAASTVNVTIPVGADNPANPPGYAPDTVTVVIGVNNTVMWTNNDTGAFHTVTSTSVPSGASSFDSGTLKLGQTFSYTFTVPGTYQYDCSFHSWMTGTVIVKGASTSPVPEFPAASLAIILFAVIAAAAVAAPRLRRPLAPGA